MDTHTAPPAPQAQTARFIQAGSKCLHLPSLEFEKLGRRDSYGLNARPEMIARRKAALRFFPRIAAKLLEEIGATTDEIVAAFESVSMHPSDLLIKRNGTLAAQPEAVAERLREITRGFAQIIELNREAAES